MGSFMALLRVAAAGDVIVALHPLSSTTDIERAMRGGMLTPCFHLSLRR